jgi:hypothetical protein
MELKIMERLLREFSNSLISMRMDISLLMNSRKLWNCLDALSKPQNLLHFLPQLIKMVTKRSSMMNWLTNSETEEVETNLTLLKYTRCQDR